MGYRIAGRSPSPGQGEPLAQVSQYGRIELRGPDAFLSLDDLKLMTQDPDSDRSRGVTHRFVIPTFLLLASQAWGLQATDLEVEDSEDPLGVETAHPRLGWRVEGEGRGLVQGGWQLRVATQPGKLDEPDLWDSGRVEGDAMRARYGGPGLESSQQVFWQVRSWDGEGRAGAWSEPASWTMGVLREEDWQARWVSSDERVENLLLRHEFEVGPGLRRALVHVSGLGQYELFFNAEKSDPGLLAPGWTDYDRTILYDTLEVTDLLAEGPNAVALSLGNGMFHVVRPEGRFAKFVGSYGKQRAILQLRLEYDDGSVELVGSDDDWKWSEGPVTFSSIFGGEDFDARRVPEGWKKPGFDDADWSRVVVFDGESGTLRGHDRAAEPIEAIETREVVEVRDLGPTTRLYDFGQNAPFIPRLRVRGPEGSVVRLTGGERVHEDGTIDRATMGGAHRGSAWWQYTMGGDGEESWFPQFYYLGSRYLHVELRPAEEGGDLPAIEDLDMVVVHSTAEPVGEFETSDPVLNRIRDLVRWAQRGNMVSILTDCPHREKLGWLEQAHLNGPALRYEWDLDRLAAKSVADMADAQIGNGLIPNVAPEYKEFEGTYRAAAEWGASFIMVPWQQYLFTGDDTLLREHFDAMKNYYAYLEERAGGGLLDEGLGDWYDVLVEEQGRANLTPPKITATAHLHQNAVVLAKIARVLGRDAEVEEFEGKAAEVRATFNRELYRPDEPELYGTGSQTSLVLPLAMGLVEDDARERVSDELIARIRKRGYPTIGAVGIRYWFQALTDAGELELIRDLITNPEIPGYAYQLAQGNTSLAESWTAWNKASQNHFFLGPVVEWFYRDLAGIAPDEEQPGFRHVRIRPNPVEGLDWVKARYDSVRGPIAVRWEQAEDRFTLSVGIPPNTDATVWMPASDPADLSEGGEPLDEREGIEVIGREGDRVLLRIASGDYEFRSGGLVR